MKKKIKRKITSKATLKDKKVITRVAKVLKKLAVNSGSQKQAMLDAGYSLNYAKSPDKIKKTRKWKEIMDDYLGEDEVAAVHKELLKASKLEQGMFPLDVDDDLIRLLITEVGCLVMKILIIKGNKYVWYRAPDGVARKAAVDMVYKLRGKYAAEKFEEVNPLKKLSNAELAERRRMLINFLTKKKK